MSSRKTTGGSRLASAAAGGDTEGVKKLLSSGCVVDAKSNDGMTALGVAAFWGYLDIVDVLLKSGADVNATNSGSIWTPLHCAAFQGHGPVVMRLLRSKADPMMPDNEGRTASDFASALDAVWPLFAAVGCKRTPKSDLVAKRIIIKMERTTARPGSSTKPQSSYMSRPGSSYRMADISYQAASLGGDVLAHDNSPIKASAGRWQVL